MKRPAIKAPKASAAIQFPIIRPTYSSLPANWNSNSRSSTVWAITADPPIESIAAMQGAIPRAMAVSASCQLHLVTARRKFCQKNFTVVTLDFDNTVPDRTATAAALFKQLSDLFQAGFGERNSAYHGDRLTAATFALAPDPDNSVTRGLTALLAADAVVYRAGAVRTDPAGIGGVDKSMVWSGLFHTHPLGLLEFVCGFYYAAGQGASKRKEILLN